MKLHTSLALWRRRVAYRRRKLARVRRAAHANQSVVTHAEAALIHEREQLLAEAIVMVARRRQEIADRRPLRRKALVEMEKLVGIVEQGGNNMGAAVMEIIRANGGTGPEPWCGDTVAFAYRKAGSTAVTRAWAGVRFLGFVAGMKLISEPRPGDIVCYSFSHTGVFKRWVDRANGEFEAIEGNTGTAGAVSDSTTGGDGVYIKRRNARLVSRWVRVTR